MSDIAHPTISFLYKTLGQKILKLILKRNGGDLRTAEGVLQDTFVAAFKSFHTFRHKSSYFTWLGRIALNKLADYYRSQVNQNFQLPINFPAPGLSPEEQLGLTELKILVNKSLDLLPPEYRKLLQLRYYEELSTREISLKLHLSPKSLEGKLYRAKKRLAKIYRAW